MTTTKAPTPQSAPPQRKRESPRVNAGTHTTVDLAAACQQQHLTPRAVIQLQRAIGNQATMRLIQWRMGSNATPASPAHRARLPAPLKAGIEALSGVDMSDVQVHHNSTDAAKIDARAYAQGDQIHLGPGQEKHLPHEAWHVVQQKLGRVRATRHLADGHALNDNPALEAEADRMGALAASHALPGNDATLRRIVADTNAPLQGFFTQEETWRKGETGFMNACFVNHENRVRYELVGYGPGAGVHPYFWVAPAENPSAMIAIRPTLMNPNVWEAIGEELRQQLDLNAQQRGFGSNTNTNSSNSEPKVHPTDFKTSMPNIRISPGKFEEGTSQSLMLETTEKEIRQAARISSLVTGFTGQVVVVPTEEGELSQYKSLDIQEQRFTASQVWVQNILISDERLNTQFGADQERHTVSFTLSRNATIRLANRTAYDLLEHIHHALQELAPYVYSIDYESTDFTTKQKITKQDNSGPMLIQAFSGSDILESLLQGRLPIDRWQFILSALIRAYYQIYQLSSGATFGHGKSNYKGEAFARKYLDDDNERAKKDRTLRRDVNAMATDAAKMIDVRMDLKVLGIKSFVFAVNHWMDLLKVMYPDLMALAGKAIVAPFLDKDVSPSYAEAVMKEQTEAKVATPKLVKTRRDLLEYYGYTPDDITSTKPVKEKLTVGGLQLPDIPLGKLETDFMVSMSVLPIAQGVSQPYAIGFGANVPQIIQLEAYAPSQVGVKAVMLGDKERPKTKFIGSQKSHTVAWTLVRHQLMAYAGVSVSIFLARMAKNLKALLTDITHTDGLQIAEQTLAVVNKFNGTEDTIHAKGTLPMTMPIQDWQALVSAVARWYLIAYSSAESASYIAPKQSDQALGNSEAWAMKILRRNEYSIASGESLADHPDIVHLAALRLLDAYLTERLDKPAAINAYHHWNEAMQDAFPVLMQKGGESIQQEILKRKLSPTETFASVLGSDSGSR